MAVALQLLYVLLANIRVRLASFGDACIARHLALPAEGMLRR